MTTCKGCHGKCYVVTERDRVRAENQDRRICSRCNGLGFVDSEIDLNRGLEKNQRQKSRQRTEGAER